MALQDHLPGGYINSVVRVGETVRRTLGPDAPFVHALLRHFEARGFEGAPRFLGIDAQGREVLSFIEGHVAYASEQPPGVWSDESLLDVVRLTRRFHDLTAGTRLAGGSEVVCHNDLSPRNTVYIDRGEGYRPVAFIDWDGAHPGRRVEDIADIFWQFLGPGPKHPWLDIHIRRMRAMCDSYGLADRSEVVRLMEHRMRGCIAGIIAKAAAGSAPHARLVELGAPEEISIDAEWVAANREALEEGIR